MKSEIEELKELCLECFKKKYADISIDDIEVKDRDSVDGMELEVNPVKRLGWELSAIEFTGTAGLFLNIARFKTKYKVKDYEMISRGCVGASFVAYLSGITEIDPLEYGLSPYFLFGEKGDKEPNICLNLRSDIRDLFVKEMNGANGEYPGVNMQLPGGISIKCEIYSHIYAGGLYELEKITGVDPCSIDFEDSDVMDMFRLKGASEESLGSINVPEFGTDFMQKMLKDIKPKKFDDLVTAEGLSHGTNTWIDNAERLIKSGVTGISGVIGTRDDVYRTMVKSGMDCKTAYKIADDVRMGRPKKSKESANTFAEKWSGSVEEMKKHGIPEWYIDSCERIGYLFPRAHCIAYVQSVWRLAWYKLHYPLEFYKVMIDEIYYDADFEGISIDSDKYAMYLKQFMEEEKGKLNSPFSIGILNYVRKQHNACRFFSEFYREGFKLTIKRVRGKNYHPCEIDRDNNAIVVSVLC